MSDSGKENFISKGPYEITVQPLLAEFVGVCMFVFIGCMATPNQLLTLALAQGMTIALLIIGLGTISGGHFNPAVTLGVLIAGAIKPALAWCYFIAQLLGGLLGAAFARAMMPSYIYRNIKGGSFALGSDMEPSWAIVAEAVLTTLLVLTVLMSSVNATTKSCLAPLAIGFAVAVDVMSGGLTTGASMNPARALGPAIISSPVVSDSFDNHYVWWVGPLLGGLVAGVLYRLLFASVDQRWITGDRSCSGRLKSTIKYNLL
ncbi:hypothetical protein ACJMK2_033541 [Sinanodonta woodiana]|uniref:Uncharacterized protein n=1 Tax=Sinanodonta woodiana TaxID=1069815 RepID=A0ABD3WQJ4_SINWO